MNLVEVNEIFFKRVQYACQRNKCITFNILPPSYSIMVIVYLCTKILNLANRYLLTPTLAVILDFMYV